MKKVIFEDERYPDYGFTKDADGYGVTVDIDHKTFRRWKKVLDSYEAVQEEMKKAAGYEE